MTTDVIDSFRLLGKTFYHMFDTRDDSTTITDEYNKVLYTVDSHAKAHDKDGEFIGSFDLTAESDFNHWIFNPVDGKNVLAYNSSDLLKTEMLVFQVLLMPSLK